MPAATTPVQSSNGISTVGSEQRTLEIASFKLDQRGLIAIGNPTFEEWLECGKFINHSSESVLLWIGDWLNYGEFKWGETYRQATSMYDFDITTMRNAKWISYKIPPERRRKGLSFNHYNIVAGLDEEEQDKYLDRAVKEKISVHNFRQLVRKEEGEKQATKKVSLRKDTLLQNEQDNLQAIQDAKILAEQFLAKLDQIDFTTLSDRIKKEFFVTLSGVEQRCVGIEMEHSDE